MKFRNYLIIIASLLFYTSVQAQDIIFFKDGTKDSVKILEIGHRVISYKKYKRLDGPTYEVKKTTVILIEFEDGEIEVIASKPQANTTITEKYIFKKNILTLNLFGATIGGFHMGYENISKKGNFGLKTNIIASFTPDLIGLYAVGIDFNFYTEGQKRVNYFFGPSFRVGAIGTDIPFASVLFNNGVSYSAKSGFYLSTQLGLGPAVYDEDEFLVYGFFMFNIGGRF